MTTMCAFLNTFRITEKKKSREHTGLASDADTTFFFEKARLSSAR